MRIKELMLYRGMQDGRILKDMAFLTGNYSNEYYNREDLKELLFETVNGLLELAASLGPSTILRFLKSYLTMIFRKWKRRCRRTACLW